MVMKTKLSIIVLTVLALSIGAAKKETAPAKELVAEIQSHKVHRADVLFTPDGLVTRTEVNEKTLEQIASQTVTVTKLAQNKATPLLLKALQEAQDNPTNQNLNLRWGCNFYDVHGNKIHRLYINSIPSFGSLDGKPVTFSTNMMNWIYAVRKQGNT